MRARVSVTLSEELEAALDRFCLRQRVSRSDTVRAALQEYLFVREFNAIRAGMLPRAQGEGVFTDEDVFARVS